MSRLVLTDYLDLRDSAAADAAGEAQVQFVCPTDQYWLLDRAVVRSSSAATSALSVFIGGPEPTDDDLIDGSTSGNLDVADNASPWRVSPGQTLTLQWTGATAGAICRARLQGRVLSRVA